MKPFLKWMGSKNRYINHLHNYLPKDFNGNYFEPFLGSGSMYFHLQSIGVVRSAYLSDVNFNLISAYLGLSDPLRSGFMLDILETHIKNHSIKYYNDLRKVNPSTIEEIGARFLYFNRTGVSAIWRENSKGEYNTPCKKSGVNWLDRLHYTLAGNVLRDAKISYGSYLSYTQCCKPGDFVYIDPPYLEFALDNMSGYNKAKFGLPEHLELKREVDRLTDLGVYVMLSNSSDELSLDMYSDYRQFTYPVKYKMIGGRMQEKLDLLVVNYDV